MHGQGVCVRVHAYVYTCIYFLDQTAVGSSENRHFDASYVKGFEKVYGINEIKREV